MVSSVVQRTELWKGTLATQVGDADASSRDKLRSALSDMHAKVSVLSRQIHHDILGLTVHDESHLDALWETAEIIAGPRFQLTPAEAFVFGAAVLLHDTALAVAAYEGGIREISQTIEWRDIVAGEIKAGGLLLEPDQLKREKPDTYNSVLFRVLRLLHARQAEKLLGISFSRPGEKESILLLQDLELRGSFGNSIGRIAHSHHWDIDDVISKLQRTMGGAPGMPPSWTVNEVKVACLLRCADAAHIDARRAPTLLYAISQPVGTSKLHWQFQNKLNQVARSGDKIVYSAGQPFGVSEAASWWLAHDTLKMIDHEIKSSNAVLSEIGEIEFECRSVSGIESPKLLARHLLIDGWTPVAAEVRVSDPVHLARTLGGRNLYGHGAFAPIRELLQNGIDAVRARRLQEERPNDWGRVRLTLEVSELRPDQIWLHVDDNGVGMSERVLTGPLIDFGKSFWSSSLMEEEFPGLQSRRLKPIGKFGIGFFSVFILGSTVKVVTKKYTDGENSTRVLSFDDLQRRPLLKAAGRGELPTDFSTRVSILIDPSVYMWVPDQEDFGSRRARLPQKITAETGLGFLFEQLVRLTAAADVEIQISDKITNRHYTHAPDWVSSAPNVFLSEVLACHDKEERDDIISLNKDILSTLRDSEGNVLGRAALTVFDKSDNLSSGLISVGGLSVSPPPYARFSAGMDLYPRPTERSEGFVGVLLGTTEHAARNFAVGAVPAELIAGWANEQAAFIEKKLFSPQTLVEFCQLVLFLGGRPNNLPFGYLAGSFGRLDSFEAHFLKNEKIRIPFKVESYESGFALMKIADMNAIYFTAPVKDDFCIIAGASNFGRVFTSEQRKEIAKEGSYSCSKEQSEKIASDCRPLSLLCKIARGVWASDFRFKIERYQVFSDDLLNAPEPILCLTLERVG